jgi:hypothetical protein
MVIMKYSETWNEGQNSLEDSKSLVKAVHGDDLRSKSKKQGERERERERECVCVCVIEDGADNHLGNGRCDWSKSARAIAGLPLHFP